MARIALPAALLLWLLAEPARAEPFDRWHHFIAEASARFQLPADWIRRVIKAESGGRLERLGQPIVSHAGAMGLMQLMPRTWAELRTRHGLGPDPHDPRDNIMAGTAYLRAMYDRFGYPGLFAAYNAGPERYERHLATGRPLPAETRAYVRILAGPIHGQWGQKLPQRRPERLGPDSAGGLSGKPDPRGRLFVVLTGEEVRSAFSN